MAIKVGTAVALVDEMDSLKIMGRKWHIHSGYACTVIERKHVGMHRLILEPQPREIVDHINQDKLDNRRGNLRIASRALNRVNTRVQQGVSKQPNNKQKPWRARLGKEYLGSFSTYDEAVMARQARETMLQ